jgi:L1 cell adhesion molecule like protein
MHIDSAVGCISLLSTQAEKYKNEDEQQAKKIEAKNGLENYAYSMRNTIRDDKVADKLPADDKAKIEHAVEDVLKWLESNQLAEGELTRSV